MTDEIKATTEDNEYEVTVEGLRELMSSQLGREITDEEYADLCNTIGQAVLNYKEDWQKLVDSVEFETQDELIKARMRWDGKKYGLIISCPHLMMSAELYTVLAETLIKNVMDGNLKPIGEMGAYPMLQYRIMLGDEQLVDWVSPDE